MTYELKIENGKQVITYSGGLFDGLKEYYYGQKPKDGYLDVNRVKWAEMLRDLLTPGGTIITRMRSAATASPARQTDLTCVIGVIQSGINGFPDEATLQTLMRMAWGFTASEKTTLNTYFSNNNFSITVT